MAQLRDTANTAWALLYSTVGYDPKSPKYVLLRPAQPGVFELPDMAVWVLWREGAEVLRGVWELRDTVDGIPYWCADLSQCQVPGRYQLMCELDPAQPEAMLATAPFRIAQDVLLQATLRGMAFDGARVRAAPQYLGGGYLDSNQAAGRVDAHATFAVGLMRVLVRRGDELCILERAELIWAIDRTIDYILALCDREQGFIMPQAKRRQGQAGTLAESTAYGLWALATYADVFRGDSPLRARQACYRALAAEQWLEREHPEHYSPALQATVNSSFWWHHGDPAFLQRALTALFAQVKAWESGTHPEPEARMVPCFEGLYGLRKRLSRDDTLAEWLERIRQVLVSREQNAQLGVFPWATAHVSRAWPRSCGNEPVLLSAVDAFFLAELLKEPGLGDLAATNLSWVAGLHPGLPRSCVDNPPSDAPIEAAAFIYGLDARHARAWDDWRWNVGQNWLSGAARRVFPGHDQSDRPPSGFMSLLPGFMPHAMYEYGPETGSVSIKHDGLWLYAACMYGDFYR